MCGTYLVDIQTKKRKSSLDLKNLTYLVFPCASPSPHPRRKPVVGGTERKEIFCFPSKMTCTPAYGQNNPFIKQLKESSFAVVTERHFQAGKNFFQGI